ncbi:MarC family protein [Trueperella sp. LYQ143]|uniref:MarC family protein n=1 Tax=unclassified Trueperella TaxID=2630174 RepID=UPI003983805C
MRFDPALFATAFTTLLVIIDPPGNVPIFIALTRSQDKATRIKVARQSNLIALILLLVFGFFGFFLFEWMGISAEALQISGGILLLLIALQLLTGKEQDPGSAGGSIHVAVVPLGMPLLAGPGAIVAFMLFMRDSGQWVEKLTVIAALVVVLAISWLLMRFSGAVMRFLGEAGVMLLTRLSGMLLAAIATQLIISGVLGIIKSMS